MYQYKLIWNETGAVEQFKHIEDIKLKLLSYCDSRRFPSSLERKLYRHRLISYCNFLEYNALICTPIFTLEKIEPGQ